MNRFLQRILPPSLRRSAPTIPVVRLQGTIVSGGGMLRQSLSLEKAGAALERAFAFRNAPAVAIVINSPGGSAVQSRLIYQRIRDLAVEKQRKVIVFIEDVAASGGYMIALAGDEIVADASSIVGSIGVVSASFGFQDLIARIGIERRVHTAGRNKSILDPFVPEKEEDIEHLKALQMEVHQAFVDLVRARRGDRLAHHEELFSGLFWSGVRGRELGLVDHLGDIRGFLKARYGPGTRLRLISAPRGLVGRQLTVHAAPPTLASAGASLAEGLVEAAQDRALWSRYGL